MARRLLLAPGALSTILSRQSHFCAVLRTKPRDACASPNRYRWIARDGRAVSRDHMRRCSMLAHPHHDLASQVKILTVIKSLFTEREGINHCWLNYIDGKSKLFDRDGIFLVLVNAFAEDSRLISYREHIIMLERVKLLQNRYPKLNVFGLQCCGSVNPNATPSYIIQTIMEEYITFPILLLDKDFMEVTTGACYFLFEGSGDRLFHYKLDVELGSIVEMIEEFNVQKGNAIMLQNSDGDGTKHLEVKEPYLCSSFRNLLLYCPGCISVDEDGNRLFISDSNHHRIIITNIDGKILDCIGSSPGFEDGDFDSAELLRPAASYYCEAENCLYIVDSENHAIRRADIYKRVLETVYPASLQKSSGIWSWMLDKLGLAKEIDPKTEDFDLDSVAFPWHLLKLNENDFLIINRSFETSWVMNMSTGEIKQILKGVPNIMEICGPMIMNRVSRLKEVCGSMLSQRIYQGFSLDGFPYAGLISSVVDFQNYTILCDAAGQRILKCDRESRGISYLQFSDIDVLGLPYWFLCPLERVFKSEHVCRPWNEHVRDFTVLPGRCDIQVSIDIPGGTELAAPLQEGCIWRQARGSAAEVSGSEDVVSSTEKVGVAQQWFDELDNLAFSKSGMESDLHDEVEVQDMNFQDEAKVHFNCAVNTSPGTSEVLISGVLYLKLKKSQDTWEERNSQAFRILDLQNHDGIKSVENACTKFLLEKIGDIHSVVFMKPLHLRLRLECGDHPAAVTHKETISTDSVLEYGNFGGYEDIISRYNSDGLARLSTEVM